MEQAFIKVTLDGRTIDLADYVGPGSHQHGRRKVEALTEKYAGHIEYIKTSRDFHDFWLGHIVLKDQQPSLDASGQGL